MGIGAALAEARSAGGLTVAQVSQRTRIRETIIRDIERDVFSSCGGDFYARGHIRAIARVVGIDAGPLIAEYDAARTAPDTPAEGQPEPEQDRWGSLTSPSPPVAPKPKYAPSGITAAEAFRPSMPLAMGSRRRRPNWTAALAVVLLAAVALLAYHFAASSPGSPRLSAADNHHRPRPSQPAPSGTDSSSIPPSPSPSPKPVTLTPASAQAFGPDGIGQGDNPGMAGLALGDTGGWHTDWYATPTFAGLQSGTGLLIDMGKAVTISSAQLTLASAPGATVQLRVGNTPSLSDLLPVAQATNAGGALTLQPTSPASARYVLIWFTRLPPDSAGTYQETVSGIKIAGTS